tara:strand:+ start:238 stop:696 length:459 start_codon:yes stop_codon:yes gene_type:complete
MELVFLMLGKLSLDISMLATMTLGLQLLVIWMLDAKYMSTVLEHQLLVSVLLEHLKSVFQLVCQLLVSRYKNMVSVCRLLVVLLLGKWKLEHALSVLLLLASLTLVSKNKNMELDNWLLVYPLLVSMMLAANWLENSKLALTMSVSMCNCTE